MVTGERQFAATLWGGRACGSRSAALPRSGELGFAAAFRTLACPRDGTRSPANTSSPLRGSQTVFARTGTP